MKFLSFLILSLSETWAQPALRGVRELQSMQVTSLQLINTNTGAVIANLKPNSSIDISSVGSSLSINAIVSGAAKSARFAYNDNANFNTESAPPYAMCGDKLTSFIPCSVLTIGTHTVTVTPFSATQGKGLSGGALTITFSLVNSAGPSPPGPPSPGPSPPGSSPPGPSPPASSSCKTPKFVGDWDFNVKKYPIKTGEAQGAIVGDDFVIISGFFMGIKKATNQTNAINLRNPDADWRPMDVLPVPEGITHGAFVVVGMKVYMCGGYLGGHPGPHINTCLVYDHAKVPGSGNQWKFFESLPEGRAGGAMVYDPARNALIFAGGAERPVIGKARAKDYKHAWIYEMDNPGWRALPDIPYLANHMSYVTTNDASGRTRHFFVAGQIGENEKSGNIKVNFEWDAINEQWLKRKDMPFTRGHASSSTNAVPCGYIIAGGSTNEFGKTSDISYYDIASDSWTKIGDLPGPLNTPVCDIDIEAGMYRCASGFSAKRRIDM